MSRSKFERAKDRSETAFWCVFAVVFLFWLAAVGIIGWAIVRLVLHFT